MIFGLKLFFVRLKLVFLKKQTNKHKKLKNSETKIYPRQTSSDWEKHFSSSMLWYYIWNRACLAQITKGPRHWKITQQQQQLISHIYFKSLTNVYSIFLIIIFDSSVIATLCKNYIVLGFFLQLCGHGEYKTCVMAQHKSEWSLQFILFLFPTRAIYYASNICVASSSLAGTET